MIAANVMSAEIVSLGIDATVKDAIDLFQNSTLHDFPVVDKEGRPVGIVTARSILHFSVPNYVSSDLLAVMKSGPDIESLYLNLKAAWNHPIRDVIDQSFDTVKARMPTSAVAGMLINLKGDTHNILVVDEAGKLIGIISARDIISRDFEISKKSSPIS